MLNDKAVEMKLLVRTMSQVDRRWGLFERDLKRHFRGQAWREAPEVSPKSRDLVKEWRRG